MAKSEVGPKVETAKPTVLKLRVANSMQLPYVVKRAGAVYTFTPDCELPTDYAEALLKTYPKLYSKATGEPNMSEYTVRKDFAEKSLVDLVNSLSEEKQGILLDLVKTLEEGKEIRLLTDEEAAEYETLTKENAELKTTVQSLTKENEKLKGGK